MVFNTLSLGFFWGLLFLVQRFFDISEQQVNIQNNYRTWTRDQPNNNWFLGSFFHCFILFSSSIFASPSASFSSLLSWFFLSTFFEVSVGLTSRRSISLPRGFIIGLSMVIFWLLLVISLVPFRCSIFLTPSAWQCSTTWQSSCTNFPQGLHKSALVFHISTPPFFFTFPYLFSKCGLFCCLLVDWYDSGSLIWLPLFSLWILYIYFWSSSVCFYFLLVGMHLHHSSQWVVLQ